MTLWRWSRTAASNNIADSTVNLREGQGPSTLNDSARAMMAAVAKYRDDISGLITTAGTSTAYTVTSYQVLASLTDGHMVAFVPHTTNGASATLNLDSLGAKPIRYATGVALGDGVLIEGTPYVVTYNTSTEEWMLHGAFGFTTAVPVGAAIIDFGSSAPNSQFVFPYGQAISRTTYATCFARYSTQYGVGDGSTTFNLPDIRGRLVVGRDNMGGSAAGRVTTAGSGIDGAALGATGGAQQVTLSIAEMPGHTHTGTTSTDSTQHTYKRRGAAGGADGTGAAVSHASTEVDTSTTGGEHSHTFTTASAGLSGGHNNMPPALVGNYLIRII